MQEHMDHFRTVFFEECADLLAAAENHLSKFSDASYEKEDVHAVFRAVHSVKGGAGTFGFDDLVSFAHVFETVLDILRGQEDLDITSQTADLLLRANDILVVLIQNAENNQPQLPAQLQKVQGGLIEFIQNTNPNLLPKELKTAKDTSAQNEKTYIIKFIPNLDMMRFGNEPYLIFREMKRLCVKEGFKAKADFSRLPPFSEFNPENCYLSWELETKTSVSIKRIEECFEFVADDCTLSIQEKSTKETTPSSAKEKKSPLSKVENKKEAASQQGESPRTEEVPQKNTSSKTTETPAPQQKNSPEKDVPPPSQGVTEQTVHSIRVELDRIDRLVNTVGEMVIKQAMVLDFARIFREDSTQHHDQVEVNNLIKGLEEMNSHTRDLQESVMAIRAQPVKAVFARMPRLVRELATELQKDVRIEMEGENTEIDKTVIERLGEPLTHMIRNALDHGIEHSSERVKAGKPAHGTIHLSAEHKSGRIIIKIQDDGRGIHREKVLKKAQDQGIIAPGESLSGEDIDQLIFRPGFSTVSKVTNISGRGVGMDVVKKSIQALGGRVNIQSIEGKGCTFNLLLPLTLAVLDGMLVNVGSECYVIPLIHILETIRPAKGSVHSLVNGTEILDVRNKNIPLVYLHKTFGVENAVKDPTQAITVIVETEGGGEIGLVVDELVAQQQVVLKSLESNYDPIPGISAATILGNGRVSLILDVNAFKHKSLH